MKTEVSKHAAVGSGVDRASGCWRSLQGVACACVLSVACWPVYSQVTEKTRIAVAEFLKQNPDFKLDRDLQRCFEGLEKDPYCDEALIEELRSVQKNRQLDEKNRQLDEKNRQLDFVAKVGRSIDVVVALSQLGMYVDHGVVPNAKADYMAKVQSGPKFDARTREFIEEVLAWRKRNPSLSQNPYRPRLIQLAKSELEIVDAAIPTIADKKYREDFVEFRQTARQIYNGYLSTSR